MKKLALALTLALAFAPATFAADIPVVDVDSTDVPTAVTSEVDAVVLDTDSTATVEQAEQMTALADLGLPTSALESAIAEASAAYQCPWYSTYCRRDVQCDSYCGAYGAGDCISGCCACLF